MYNSLNNMCYIILKIFVVNVGLLIFRVKFVLNNLVVYAIHQLQITYHTIVL